ncbi:V-type proton ATPase subunit c'' [Tilletia horrida]|uniref:V-type proton ATPase subunit c n=1 Tax=Tilletia horrida TaxID=155126 RepID=A0AAN6GE47_9BASI|nr:V-type proton ATPase subunit c'' [Tilletia horrida]KAK0532181.1 V-type proton ATPase subunit c'' [Tilletia horrida]
MPGVVAYSAASAASLATTVGLYALLTGSGEAFNVGKFLEQTSPYAFAMMGIGFCIGLSVIGAGWGIFLTGSSILGAGVRAPRITTKNLISVTGGVLIVIISFAANSIIFCEVVAIYGVIMAIVFSSKITGNLKAGTSDSLYSQENYLTGHLLFWGGLTVGLCNLVCGVAVGVTGANAAIADAADPQLFVKVLVLEIFGSILGLFGLIVGLIMTGPAQEFS